MNHLSAPDVKSYLSVFFISSRLLHLQKNTDKDFSYEVWARVLGISSKSYLRFSTLGKRRISEDLAQKIL